MKLLRIMAVAAASVFVAGCGESLAPSDTTVPNAPRLDFGPMSHDAPFAVTSASCTVNSSTGAGLCSYSVDNSGGYQLYVGWDVLVNVDYECRHPKNGKVRSLSGRQWSSGETFTTHTNPTATDVPVSAPSLNERKGRPAASRIACKGQEEFVVTGYSLEYFEVWAQRQGVWDWTCRGSDDRYGCHT